MSPTEVIAGPREVPPKYSVVANRQKSIAAHCPRLWELSSVERIRATREGRPFFLRGGKRVVSGAYFSLAVFTGGCAVGSA